MLGDFIDPFMNTPVGTLEELVFADPRVIVKQTKPLIAAGWKLLAGAVTLRQGGQTSDANSWLNALMKLKLPEGKEELLRAEMLAEGGLALYATGDTGQAIEILNAAAGRWRNICSKALPSLQGEKNEQLAELEQQLTVLAEAIGLRKATGGKGRKAN